MWNQSSPNNFNLKIIEKSRIVIFLHLMSNNIVHSQKNQLKRPELILSLHLKSPNIFYNLTLTVTMNRKGLTTKRARAWTSSQTSWSLRRCRTRRTGSSPSQHPEQISSIKFLTVRFYFWHYWQFTVLLLTFCKSIWVFCINCSLYDQTCFGVPHLATFLLFLTLYSIQQDPNPRPLGCEPSVFYGQSWLRLNFIIFNSDRFLQC